MQNSECKTGSVSLQNSLPLAKEKLVPWSDFDSRSFTLSDVESDIIIRSRIKYGSFGSACKGMFMEYSKRTTIHGLRYLFEVHRPFYERIYWFVLVATSFYFAISLTWATYLKWQDTPVILGFDETLMPIHKIPFPTITICPEIKLDSKNFGLGNVSRKIWEEIERNGSFENKANLTEEQISNFAATLHLCDDLEMAEHFAKFLPKNITTNVVKTLVNLSHTKNRTLPFCKWNRRLYMSEDVVAHVATDEGICFQFNGLRNKDIYRDERFISVNDDERIDFSKTVEDKLPQLNNITGEWSPEKGFQDQGINAYPQRTIYSSSKNGFFIFLQGLNFNTDFACRNLKQGYKVFFTSPESIPFTSGNYILIPHGQEVLITILPHYILASENLRDISPEKRQCYFNDERYLRFFRFYSQINCRTECLANYTISQCGCAKYWMPKPQDVPICNASDISCYTQAEENLKVKLLQQELQKEIDPSSEIMCGCMPGCISLEYNFELSNAHFDVAKTMVALGEELDNPDLPGSRLSVYFKQHHITAIKRTVVFGITTFISNCGGIFGLFMGISSLSLIEILYFCSMRFIANLRRRRACKNRLLEMETITNPQLS